MVKKARSSQVLRGTAVKLSDPDAERARRSLDDRVQVIQKAAVLNGKLFENVRLPNSQDVPIRHGLGRKGIVLMGPPRASGSATTGRIREVGNQLKAQFDPKEYTVLKANGWGETIYLDIWVF